MKKLLSIWLLAASVYGAPVEVITQDILSGDIQKKVIEDKSYDQKPAMDTSLNESIDVLHKNDVRIVRVADRIQFVILTNSIFDDTSKEMTKDGLATAKAIGDIVKGEAHAVNVVSLASTKLGAQRVDKQAKVLMNAIGTIKTPLIYFSYQKDLQRNSVLPFWAEQEDDFLETLFDESPLNNIIVVQVQLNTGQKF